LLKALHNAHSHVSSSAAQSLQAFPSHADTIIPELRKAAERKDAAAGSAKRSLKFFESPEGR